MVRLIAQPLDAAAFAPFGHVVPRADAALRTIVRPISGVQNRRPGVAELRLAWFAVPASVWPMTARLMERHRFSTQSFVPCGSARWLVLVAPHSPGGGPDPTAAKAFVATGAHAVTLLPDTWHHPLTVLETAHFTVLTALADDANDEEFHTLSEPIVVSGL